MRLLVLTLFALAQVPDDAVRLWEEGRRRAAVDVMTEALRAKSENPALRQRLVECEMQIGRYKSALEHMVPLGEDFDATRGTALYLIGEYERALPFLAPDDPALVLYRHESLRALNRLREAEEALDFAAELLGDGHVEVLVRRGQRELRAGEYRSAIPLFERALRQNPIQPEALFGLGRARLRTGEREVGLELLERHRKLTPLVDRLDFAERNLELDLTHAPNHAALADVLREIAPFDPSALERALHAYRNATRIARAGEHVPIALRFARCLAEQKNDADAAVAVLDRAWAVGKDPRLAVRAGDILLASKQPKDALERYQRALAIRPNDGAVQQRIARARAAIEGSDR